MGRQGLAVAANLDVIKPINNAESECEMSGIEDDDLESVTMSIS